MSALRHLRAVAALFWSGNRMMLGKHPAGRLPDDRFYLGPRDFQFRASAIQPGLFRTGGSGQPRRGRYLCRIDRLEWGILRRRRGAFPPGVIRAV